jgi:4-amino-4-deoxy-L-arabinose transferase-like glycosyltransferase
MVSKRLYRLWARVVGAVHRLPAGAVARQPWLWLLLWLLPLLVLNAPQQSLLTPREGLYAHQAWEMLHYNDWITLGWWGTPLFDRTPGMPWLIALSYHWFGPSQLAARLPSMAAAVGAIALTWRLGQRLRPPALGLWGAGIFAALPLWMQAAKLATPDALLVALALLAIWALLRSEDHPDHRIGWGMVAGLALGLGFVAQGALGLLPLVALLPYLGWSHRSHRHLSNLGLYYGLALGALPLAVWLGRSLARYGDLPWQQLSAAWLEQLGGLGPGGGGLPTVGLFAPWGASVGVTYYLWHLVGATFPWVGFALVGAWQLGRDRSLGRRTLWLGYPLVLLGLLSLLHIQPWQSVLLIYPFWALLAAVGLHQLGRWFRSRAPRRYRVAVGLSWGAGVVGILLMSAGSAVLVTPGMLIAEALRPYGWLGVAGGLGLLLPWLMALNRWGTVTRQQQRLWQWGWLLGPWLLTLAAFATGIFGDYTADLTAAIAADPVPAVLANHPVHFVRPDRDRESVFLTTATPHRGKPLSSWSQVPSEGYAWGNPSVVPFDPDRYEVIATVGEWQLVRAPLLPAAVPRG